MQVILRADVEGLGKRGDVVDVTDGFARNHLVPKGLAMRATPGAIAQAHAMRRARDVKDARAKEAAEQVAQTLVPRTITVPARAGTGGRLFGSVTSADIARAVEAETGIELDRRSLLMDEPIKTLGVHSVRCKLHPEVDFFFNVEVVPA